MVAFVYRSSNRKQRQDLWRKLRTSNLTGHLSWAIIGDFNYILASNEKLEGLFPRKRCPHFREFVESTNLHNIRFRGYLAQG